MPLKFSTYDVPVGTSWGKVVTVFPARMHSLLIYAEGALEIGAGGAGLPRAASEYFALTWQDFDLKKVNANDSIDIYAQAPGGATNAVVTLITGE